MPSPRRVFAVALHSVGLLLCSFLLTNCSFLDDNDRPLKGDGVTATVINEEVLTIVNKRDARIWTFSVNPDVAISITWSQWVGPGGIAPGDRQVVPIEDLIDGASATSIQIFWWEAVFEDGEQVPGSLQSFTIDL